MEKTYILDKKDIPNFLLEIEKPCLIFLRGDLGVGKTTLSSQILYQVSGFKKEYTSPTYVYYNIYGENYHFDLYRISSYEEFVQIGGEEILDSYTGLVLVEWPDIIEKFYQPDIEIFIEKIDSSPHQREIKVVYKNI